MTKNVQQGQPRARARGSLVSGGDEVDVMQKARARDVPALASRVAQRYESALNTYKPFACGIVLHPAIDAAIQLRNENKLTADQIDRVELKVHPLVLELTGKGIADGR